MKKYILSFDQGTTSSRCLVIDRFGTIVSSAQKEFTQIFPQPSWVEHDAEEIWQTQYEVAVKALKKAKLTAKDIAAIGIANQRETTVVWDKKTGKPIHNAIVWQDRRTADYCESLKKQATKIQEKTGLIVDAYFSGTKLKWILETVSGARAKAETGELCFGTIDSWLVFKLTNGKSHVTDVSNASRTMLFNIHTLDWDKELLNEMNIPENCLPQVKSNSEYYGTVEKTDFLDGIPITGMAGDQQAALFGQMCTESGRVKNTYGTGCFMLMNTGEKAVLSKNKLLTTIAWKIGNQVHYALEGSVFVAGAVVQWLRDGLGIIKKSSEVEALAMKVIDNQGVYFVPAFVGLGAPYWEQNVRGTIIGLTRGTTAATLARAALESIAYQSVEVLQAMEADSGIRIQQVRVDGGASINNLLMQFQSDILNTKVVRPKNTETTAMGAAYLAGLSVGFWKNTDEIQKQWQMEREFLPSMSEVLQKNNLEGWKKAVKMTLS